MPKGWIKLHRSMTSWEWYNDIPTFKLFVHLLITANHKDNNWKGIVVKRGEKLTGRISLAKETNLTEQQVRTALTKLKSTNEITIKSTNKFSLVKVNNYDDYQQDSQQLTKPTTNNQPTNNQQITTNKNDKNDKNERITTKVVKASPKKIEYGNKDINLIYDFIKEKTGLPAVSGQASRNFTNNLLKVMRKNFPEEKSPAALVCRVVDIAFGIDDNWHSNKANDPKHLYYNWQEIINKGGENQKKEAKTKITESEARRMQL